MGDGKMEGEYKEGEGEYGIKGKGNVLSCADHYDALFYKSVAESRIIHWRCDTFFPFSYTG